jgi:rhodanese-related sulfurtransferase
MRPANGVLRDDLLWAVYLLILAVIFGLAYQWPLVKIAWHHGLTSYLEQVDEHRRTTEFKGVPAISLEEAHELWKEGQSLFLDAREADDFAELHIPKAVNLPLARVSEIKNTGILGFPRDRRIVVYCAQKQCSAALKMGKHLKTLGFTRVMVFLEGFQGWDDAGYEVDSSR